MTLSHLEKYLDDNPSLEELHFVVTGSSGFLGSNIVSSMSNLGLKGFAIDSKDPHDKIFSNKIAKQFKFIKADLSSELDIDMLKNTLPDSFHLIHLASPNTEKTNIVNKSNKIDFKGFTLQSSIELSIAKNLLSLVKNRASFFLYASSIDVFNTHGSDKKLVNEETQPIPDSPYGFGKLLSEGVYKTELKKLNIPLTILRLPQIYGDYEFLFYKRAIPNFIKLTYLGRPLHITTNLQDSRQYLHCNDILFSILSASSIYADDLFMIAGRKVSLKELITNIQMLLNRKVVYELNKTEKKSSYEYTVDCDKAQRVLGFKQFVDIEQGLKSAIEIYKNITI